MVDLSNFAKYDEAVGKEQAEGGGEFGPLPQGEYTVVFEDRFEVKDTKNGDSQYLNCMVKVVGPIAKGAVIFDMIALSTTSNDDGKKKWVEIGHDKLQSIAYSAGFNKMPSTDMLVGKEVNVYVTIQKDDGYGEKNKISRYMPKRDVKESDSAYPKRKSGASDDLPF